MKPTRQTKQTKGTKQTKLANNTKQQKANEQTNGQEILDAGTCISIDLQEIPTRMQQFRTPAKSRQNAFKMYQKPTLNSLKNHLLHAKVIQNPCKIHPKSIQNRSKSHPKSIPTSILSSITF